MTESLNVEIKTMSLRKALRMKNVLKGQIAELASKIKYGNVFNDNTPTEMLFDAKAGLEKLLTLKADLINLKAAIAKANVGIYERIAIAEELKSDIALFKEINTNSSPERTGLQDKEGNEIFRIRHCWLSAKEIEERAANATAMLERVLDEIDDFNAKTQIELPTHEFKTADSTN
jgi:hypothetical protein